MIKLTRAYLERIVAEEAGISGADPHGVLCGEIFPGYSSIRHRVWYRAHLETGATAGAIASLWGCEYSSVRDGITRLAHAWETLNARLEARHGPERAASIIAGRDPASNADRASWKALGRRPGAAA